MKSAGKLFVISAPSGAGKTSLCNMLMEKYSDLKYSISYTTRPPRPDEKDGLDYFFIDEEKFRKMIDEGEFIEWAHVHGNYYGTSGKTIETALQAGENIILDIDPQGARQLKGKLGYGIYIFIIAPGIDVLEERLRKRRTETPEKLALRLKNALEEVKYFKEYDYILVNDEIGKAFKDLEGIYLAEHLRTEDIEKIEDIFEIK